MTAQHVPSLAQLDLAAPHRHRPLAVVRLDAAASHALLEGLVRNADEAAARLADQIRRSGPADPASAITHILTRNRFFKGSRTGLPLDLISYDLRRHVRAGDAVPLLLRAFPYKQSDNRLKATGPLPDLAEAGALIRLRELLTVIEAIHPPGAIITVLKDGGYYRERPLDQLRSYDVEVRRLAGLFGLTGRVEFVAQGTAFATMAGTDRWQRREWNVVRTREEVAAVVGQAARTFDAGRAGWLLATTGLVPIGGPVPPFDALFRSLLYSIPIVGGPDPEWTSRVLADVTNWQVPGMLGEARRQALALAWRQAIDYVAISIADEMAGFFTELPHLRLSAAPRPGVLGFGHLGGSVLPWHGTGSVDGRHRVGADFSLTLLDRGAIDVRSESFAIGQPWFLADAGLRHGDGLVPDLARKLRLKAR